MADQERQTRGVDDLVDGLDNVLFGVWLVSRATTAMLDDALRGSGLDADEFAIYSVLASGDGMTPTELARWMAAPTTTVSSSVKRFEARGHVRRLPNPDDGRSQRIALTPAGRRAHRVAGEHFGPVLEEVNAALGPEGPDTMRRLRSLRRAVAVERRPRTPPTSSGPR